MATPPKLLSPGRLKYQKVLLKISGEVLCGELGYGIDPKILSRVADELIAVHKLGLRLALVVGGGNIFRGTDRLQSIDRATGDYMGMLATCINALALQSALEIKGVDTRVQTALRISEAAEPYIRRKALQHLSKNRIVIFAAGTSNPYFTTDTAAALRAMEISADILLKATKVDGVYSADPATNKNAEKYEELKYIDILNKDLKIMDSTAVSLCMSHKLPVLIFNLKQKGNILRIVKGEKLGTLVH